MCGGYLHAQEHLWLSIIPAPVGPQEVVEQTHKDSLGSGKESSYTSHIYFARASPESLMVLAKADLVTTTQQMQKFLITMCEIHSTSWVSIHVYNGKICYDSLGS